MSNITICVGDRLRRRRIDLGYTQEHLAELADVHPTYIGHLPPVLAAMNMTNINTQLLTIEAARTRRREDILRAVMLEPHTAAELSIDDMAHMVDDLIEAHGPYMAMYR